MILQTTLKYNKGAIVMSQDKLSEYCEFVALSKQLLVADDKDDFISFLYFCEERLHKGDQVQAIWCDYQNQAK